MNSEAGFCHRLGAHCESSTIAGLLRHAGAPLSEPMVFGIAGAIFFGYFDTRMLPFPTFTARSQPGKIRDYLTKYLRIEFPGRRFRHPGKASAALDALLARGTPAAVQVDFFYMDYVPPYSRAHFNGHFVTVAGKRDGVYWVSDAYCAELKPLDAATLERARFARGSFAPRGFMYHVGKVPANLDIEKAIRRGIKHAAFFMLRLPIPFLGVAGIRRLAKKLLDWPRHAVSVDRLAHEMMMIHVMLEDRGTGGAGFRYLYATFLQEAAGVLGKQELACLAREMMENGDAWRAISLFAARTGKKRDVGPDRLEELSAMVRARADAEERLFQELAKVVA
ncbi:MAG TPA: BtrH N-terminal domain-containing protein [Candidatus Hydrogenedentes bacterium]|nr:BtrH N-terminal domain-containing protein [Candidatus Hydrogenedentota bacterium]HOS02777.1 BtrH N-terminal domain-containing protein [Candidatus Hydrogenedentota bacterium]